MPNYTRLNLQQMIAATKIDIIRAQAEGLAAEFDKRGLIKYLLELGETVTITIPTTHYPDGQVDMLEEREIDVETSTLVRRKRTKYTYYTELTPAPVNIIEELVTDGQGAQISRRRIKHFPDGRPPLTVNG